jgi:hypothetical protein
MFPHIILLSMDTEVGLNRRSALNYEYERLPITDENIIPPSFITERFDTRSPVVPSHLWSYLCILRMIIDRQIDSVVVCEDDAFLIGDLKDLIGLKEATLCGGVIHGSVDFKDGVNPITHPWTQMFAIYYPTWQEAKRIYDYTMKSPILQVYDVFLSQHKLINQLFYPSIFVGIDNIDENRQRHQGISQIGNVPDGVIMNYKVLGSSQEVFDRVTEDLFKI